MVSVFTKLWVAGAARIAGFVLFGAAMSINAAHAQSGPSSTAEIAALKAELEAVKRALPGHAHVMAELDYHFSNLWFAGQHGNWPLAEFYLNETRSNLNWMVRIRPTRRLSTGQDMDLTPVVKAVEDSVLTSLRAAIGKQDSKAFEAAYRQTLEQCYACHKMVEKPYLRPQIPEAPASRMINPRVNAEWPR
jgi:hypothetical protein